MNIKDLQASLEYLFKAEITAFIWGHAGLGKSSVVKKYAESKGYKFFPFYLGTMSDVGDVLGLATFTKNAEGQDVATHFAPPIWLKEMIDYCEQNADSGAIVFLDEFNRGRRDILNGMFSLALDKTFHTIKLPKNCHIIAAGNPPTEEYYTTDVNETALMARFAHIKLEPTIQEWMNYAKDNCFEESVISFLQEQPELIEDGKSTFTLPVKVDRRSYERVNRLFKVNTPVSLRKQLMHGIIGVERTIAYEQHVANSDKILTGEEVLEGTKSNLLEQWSNPKDIKASMLAGTCDNILDKIVEMSNTVEQFTLSEGDNLLKFLEVLPRDISYQLFVKLLKKDVVLFKNFARNDRYEKRLIEIAKEAKGTTTTTTGASKA